MYMFVLNSNFGKIYWVDKWISLKEFVIRPCELANSETHFSDHDLVALVVKIIGYYIFLGLVLALRNYDP